MKKNALPFLAFLCALSAGLSAEPLFSPSWGFYLDLPEGYQFSGGDGKDLFSFSSAEGAVFDLAVYAAGAYASAAALAEDTGRRLGSRGERSPFRYRDRGAVLMELEFPRPGGGGRVFRGWGLCLELEEKPGGGGRPLLLALAYDPGEREGLHLLHLSALDSIAPTAAERRAPGPLTEFGFPRGELKPVSLAGSGLRALIGEHDGEAARFLAERELAVLSRHIAGSRWREAWIRFYRTVYRDSFERLADAAFVLERRWNVRPGEQGPSPPPAREEMNREFAGKLLAWVQGFSGGGDISGEGFVNPVSAAVEGRGDSGSRALLWALVLEQADIPSGLMVSRDYGHIMGLADLPGEGARFDTGGKKWLVAETSAPVSLGLIGANVADPGKWLGLILEPDSLP